MANQKRELLADSPDLTELRQKAKAFDDLEAANKTDLEKAQAQIAKAEKERDEALKLAETTSSEAKETRLRAAIFAEAAKPDRKVVDPETAAQLLDRGSLELDDSGRPTNIAKAMDALLEAKPFLVSQGGPTRQQSADLGARPRAANQVTDAELSSMTPEQIVQARKDGRLVDLGVAP
jgi:hypothetical protein